MTRKEFWMHLPNTQPIAGALIGSVTWLLLMQIVRHCLAMNGRFFMWGLDPMTDISNTALLAFCLGILLDYRKRSQLQLAQGKGRDLGLFWETVMIGTAAVTVSTAACGLLVGIMVAILAAGLIGIAFAIYGAVKISYWLARKIKNALPWQTILFYSHELANEKQKIAEEKQRRHDRLTALGMDEHNNLGEELYDELNLQSAFTADSAGDSKI